MARYKPQDRNSLLLPVVLIDGNGARELRSSAKEAQIAAHFGDAHQILENRSAQRAQPQWWAWKSGFFTASLELHQFHLHNKEHMKKLLILSAIALLASGCSTYSASRYSISTDNVVALRSLNGKTLNVGAFSATTPGQKEIMCRGVGPIKTPDGEPFVEFVRKALLDELKIANSYSPSAPITITGNLDAIDFSSNSGNWNLALTVKASNGKSMSVSESYAYTSSFYGETACNQTAQAFMPAVQNLVGKVVRSPEFIALVSQ